MDFVREFLEDSKKAGIENMIDDWELVPFVELRLTTISEYVKHMILKGTVTRQLSRRTGESNVKWVKRLQELAERPDFEGAYLGDLCESLVVACEGILTSPRMMKNIAERHRYRDSLGSRYEYNEKSFWRFK